MLLQSGVRPILLIAFTNHALDHLLEAVLDAKITSNVVRLGSKERATERLKQYSLDTLELVQDQSRLDKAKREERWKLKGFEKQIEEAVRKISQREVSDDELDQHMSLAWPDHHFSLKSPPPWAHFIFEANAAEAEGWQKVGQGPASPPSLFAFWLAGEDLNYLVPKPLPSAPDVQKEQGFNRFAALAVAEDVDSDSASSDDEVLDFLDSDASDEDFEAAWMHVPSQPGPSSPSDEPAPLPPSPVTVGDELRDATPPPVSPSLLQSDLDRFFAHFGIPVPTIPTSNRQLEELQLLDGGLWLLSRSERQTLADFWKHEARELYHQSSIQQFDKLREQLAESQRRFDALADQVRSHLLLL